MLYIFSTLVTGHTKFKINISINIRQFITAITDKISNYFLFYCHTSSPFVRAGVDGFEARAIGIS